MEKKVKKIELLAPGWLTLCLVTICLISFTGIAQSIASEPQYGGTYRTTMTEPRRLDPHMMVSENENNISGNTFNGLIRWNDDMTDVELELAKSWKRIDDFTYEFKILKGVHFHDLPPVNGRELTSEDVKYTIERMAGMHGKKSKIGKRYYFMGRIASIETPDRYTVIFKTNRPNASFINYLASACTCIVPREAVEAFGDLNTKNIGTGPFILKEYQRGSHITLVKNPNYYKKGLPYLDKIHFKIMRTPAASLSAFLAGRLDTFSPYFYQLDTLKKEAPDTNIVEQPGSHVLILRIRPWVEGKPHNLPFGNVKVRQAVAKAIDKKRVLELGNGGYGIVQVGPIPNWPPYSLPASDQVEYNPEEAKKLLAEAGYPDGFSTQMVTWNSPYMAKPAQAIQSMLGKVGINMELKLMEFAQYFNFVYRFDYDMSLHMTTAGVDPEAYLNSYFGRNSIYYKWRNEEIWRLCDEQLKILDRDKRADMIRTVQRKILDDAPFVFLYTMNRYTAMKPYVHRKFVKEDYEPLIGETLWMEKH
jgi:peptide/nickel transport system substrate-binding protein